MKKMSFIRKHIRSQQSDDEIRDIMTEYDASLCVPETDGAYQPSYTSRSSGETGTERHVEFLENEFAKLRNEFSEFQRRFEPILIAQSRKTKDIEDRARVILYDIGKRLERDTDIVKIYLEFDDEYTTFHIVTTSGKLDEAIGRISITETAITSNYPEDGVRFRVYEDDEIDDDDFEGSECIEWIHATSEP